MIPELPTPVLAISCALLVIALFLAAYRMWRGPTLADRVMTLDLTGGIFMGCCAVLAIHSGRELFLDAALAVAVIAFLATIALSAHIDRK